MMRKVLAGVLMGLTVVFFVVSYFGITTSGEDIHQGAGTEPAVLEDAQAAFRHNARLPDMYAWAVINFFDYQYSFGVDTIFRVIDVMLGVGMLYLMVYGALGRKVKLELKDAVLWALGFLMIFLTPHGRVLYAGFSAIHNYLLIVMIALGFGLWYMKRVRGEELKDEWWRGILMLLGGVGFGLSSNLTPVAFLLTAVGVVIVRMVRAKKVRKVLRGLRIWEVLGVVGILVGIAVAYIGGPGVSDYIDSGYATEYDYVSLGEIVAEPVRSMGRLVKHGVSNGVRVVAPAIGVLAVFAVLRLVRKWWSKSNGKLEWWPKEKGTRRLLVVLVGFVVVHVLVATQLNAPIRILLPAYVAEVIGVMILVREWTRGWRMEMVGAVMLVLVVSVVGVRTVWAIDYHGRAGKVLMRIRESEAQVVCVEREEINSRVLPMIYLGQEEMLADWAMPERIYDKEVVWCQ